MRAIWKNLLGQLVLNSGSQNLGWTKKLVAKAALVGEEMTKLSDADLAQSLRDLDPSFIDSDKQLVRFLAIVRELADRRVGLRPFDVQLRAVAAMLRGISVEMATGEGKTLVGAIVATGLVQAGRQVHVLSANDYLAQRDATWMGPLLTAADFQVAWVTSLSSREDRHAAYGADVVYVSVTEAGFDVLRDRLAYEPEAQVGIRHDAAIIDEADAVLLDEARVPLILAGEVESPAEAAATSARTLALFVAELAEGVHYEVDDDQLNVHLTEAGLEAIEFRYAGVDLFDGDDALLSRVNTAVYAEALLERDIDYVVEDGRVRLVSQTRGRIEALQRWPEGLQEAVEAKEDLTPSASVDILDQILIKDLVGLYTSQVGMSATLAGDAEEIFELYGLRVGELPPNRECIRLDEPDRLYDSLATRDAAMLELISEAHADGQPILIGTQSVAESERFAGLLATHEFDCVVLNAKNDSAEAAIIAEVGTAGRITVSTQMAGRGVDIRLAEGVADLGGLLIIALERFGLKRLDDQLRGRAGRQGDPGRTVFFTSLEDDLILTHAADHTEPYLITEDGVVEDRALRGLCSHAQRVAEGQQRGLRDLSERYGRLLAIQRNQAMTVRNEVLTGEGARRLLIEAEPERVAELDELIDPADLGAATRKLMLSCLDRQWCDHLAYVSAVREGIHLQALGGQEPIRVFNTLIAASASKILDQAIAEASEILNRAKVVGGQLDLTDIGLYKPGATWTYMVTDDHFGSWWERLGKFFADKAPGKTP